MIYYTITEAASYLGVSRQVVNNWVARDNGRMPTPAARTATNMALWTVEQLDRVKQDIEMDLPRKR